VPEVSPFAGIRYQVSSGDLRKVLAPPYDVISPAAQRELYERDPRNVIRLILNRTPGEAGYAEAGATFRRWMEEGVLSADPSPGYYLLEQAFEAGGRPLVRHGLFARFRAEDPERGVILPHEQTRKGPREDRYRLLKATRANFSPIFLMFPDPAGRFAAAAAEVAAAPPLASYTDDGGVAHRLWRVGEDGAETAFQRSLAGAKAYIADGHHRHATALRYRDEVGPEGAWTMGYFTPLEGPGLVVLPYHRILSAGPSLAEARRALQGLFRVTDAASVGEAAHRVERSTASYAFALAEPGEGALLTEALPAAERLLPDAAPPSLRALDTWFLHQAVLQPLLKVPDEAVDYVHSQAEAEEAVARGACRLAVLMRPTPVGQIVDVAEARESMPAKSTFFHPKVPSGLVIHPLVI
jgi:uncharacterized protein (DUF1015 family)